MRNIVDRIIRRATQPKTELGKEIKVFLPFLRRSTSQVDNDALKEMLKRARRASSKKVLNLLPGLYLFSEKILAYEQDHGIKTVENLRRQMEVKFPGLVRHEYFEPIFCEEDNQELVLWKQFIKLVRYKNLEANGSTNDNFFTTYMTDLSNRYSQYLLVRSQKSGLVNQLQKLTLDLYEKCRKSNGEKQTKAFFKEAYEVMDGRYRYLECFGILVKFLPLKLVSEGQFFILNNTYNEDAFVKKIENLDTTIKHLKTEITKGEIAKRSFQQSVERLQQIISNAMDAVIFVDATGIVRFWNSQAEKIFGWYEDEALGKRLSSLIIPPERRSKHQEILIDQFISGGRSTHSTRIEYIGQSKNGNIIPIELSIVANESDEDVVFAYFVRDISERRKYEADLLNAKEKAEKASQAKADFLSTMSHEIRTPMNGLFGTIELLLGENPREDQQDSLNLMKHSTENLLVIVNDILDFSKLDHGKVEFENREFSLEELSHHIIATHEMRAQEKGLDFELIKKNLTWKHFNGDPVRLSQVLNNLISNAIKFTKTGAVFFRLLHLGETETESVIRFEIEDTGIGIPEKELARIFERFSQVRREDYQDMYHGTGLGLAIAQKIVELMGGRIYVRSQEGVGSLFFFELELEKSKPKPSELPVVTKPIKNLEDVKILVAEDNRVNQIVLGRFLKKWKCAHKFVNNGQLAVDEMKNEHYDLILMDLQMPVMDGFRATELIRTNEDTSINQIPIIALSADVLPETKNKALQMGMSNFMTKPFDPEKLFHAIKSSFRRAVEIEGAEENHP